MWIRDYDRSLLGSWLWVKWNRLKDCVCERHFKIMYVGCLLVCKHQIPQNLTNEKWLRSLGPLDSKKLVHKLGITERNGNKFSSFYQLGDHSLSHLLEKGTGTDGVWERRNGLIVYITLGLPMKRLQGIYTIRLCQIKYIVICLTYGHAKP